MGSQIPASKFAKMFEYIDIDRSGKMTVHELASGLNELPEPVLPKVEAAAAVAPPSTEIKPVQPTPVLELPDTANAPSPQASGTEANEEFDTATGKALEMEDD